MWKVDYSTSAAIEDKKLKSFKFSMTPVGHIGKGKSNIKLYYNKKKLGIFNGSKRKINLSV